jgi:hypothetical protein
MIVRQLEASRDSFSWCTSDFASLNAQPSQEKNRKKQKLACNSSNISFCTKRIERCNKSTTGSVCDKGRE